VGDLLDALIAHLDERGKGVGVEDDETEGKAEAREIRLAIVGRPNVGKSSLLNRLLGEERVIVSPVAGTTRDAVDTVLAHEGQRFRLIDTAGIRRKGKTEEMAEKLSVIMARRSLERADVAVVVVDAAEGVAALDANIAGYAVDAGCSIILAVNKWDALGKKETGTASEFERDLRLKMKFLEWAPVVTI
ncbi:MAG TPA: GTP-binding protein, partial [Pyrinomonadaceae bacterium]|nr:GTP-binding protein [Pyrinomonadaceae bacterium]